MNDKIYFAKMHETAVIPSKREEDGAYDIYACFEEEERVLAPHETCLIPTGLASAFSSDYVAIFKERGSTGTKGMGQRCGVIDSGYRGEWFVAMTNHNDKPLVITKKDSATYGEEVIVYPYQKAVAQCMMVEVPKLKIEEISLEALQNIASERGAGRLGSSGK